METKDPFDRKIFPPLPRSEFDNEEKKLLVGAYLVSLVVVIMLFLLYFSVR